MNVVCAALVTTAIIGLVQGDGDSPAVSVPLSSLSSSSSSSLSSSSSSSFPPTFDLKSALEHYAIESRSLLASSMEVARFDIDQMDSYDPSYLDFATRALDAETGRIGKIRDSLLRRKMEAEDLGGTCSMADHEAGKCENKIK